MKFDFGLGSAPYAGGRGKGSLQRPQTPKKVGLAAPPQEPYPALGPSGLGHLGLDAWSPGYNGFSRI